MEDYIVRATAAGAQIRAFAAYTKNLTEEARKAQDAARALFTSGNAANMPTFELTSEDLTEGSIDILSILVKAGLCPSRSDARTNVQQGGVTVNDEKVTDFKAVFAADTLSGDGLVVKKGKKNFKRVVLK